MYTLKMYGVHKLGEGMRSKVVFVTGVSSGIGLGIAEVLAKHGFQVFGSVRKQVDADRLQSVLGEAFTPFILDVTQQADVLNAAERASSLLNGANLAGLVNNAGVSLVGPLLHQPLEDMRAQLDVNLVGPLRVIQAFASLLGTDKTRRGGAGRIVNISSVGGKMAFPYLGAYAASKHGLEGLSESLRRELMLYDIDVILIEPGYVNTPILDKAQAEDYARYRATDYATSLEKFRTAFIAEGRKGLAPQRIGDAVLTALTSTSPHTAYPVVQQKFKNWTLPRLLPKRWLDTLVGKQFGLLPSK
jgi:NAD(P)-dependent dehydrogenase (short-subunit alcohol dehydrogenase family)